MFCHGSDDYEATFPQMYLSYFVSDCNIHAYIRVEEI